MKGRFQLALAALILAALPCLASDSAILRNGFSIRHERRQVIGTVTRLYVDGDDSSFVDIPTAEIDHFESTPDDPATPAKSPVAADKVARPIDLNEVILAASDAYRLDPD